MNKSIIGAVVGAGLTASLAFEHGSALAAETPKDIFNLFFSNSITSVVGNTTVSIKNVDVNRYKAKKNPGIYFNQDYGNFELYFNIPDANNSRGIALSFEINIYDPDKIYSYKKGWEDYYDSSFNDPRKVFERITYQTQRKVELEVGYKGGRRNYSGKSFVVNVVDLNGHTTRHVFGLEEILEGKSLLN